MGDGKGERQLSPGKPQCGPHFTDLCTETQRWARSRFQAARKSSAPRSSLSVWQEALQAGNREYLPECWRRN